MAKKKKAQSNMSDADIKKLVKAEEDKARDEMLKKIEDAKPKVRKVSFDSWYAIRQTQIPSSHRKEVLLADFKARGCELQQSMEDWDKMLLEYGLKV